MKVCIKCGVEKSKSEFHKKADGKDGLRSICKVCRKAYNQTDEAKAYRKAYDQTDKYKTYRKEYQQTDEYKATLKAYMQTDGYKAYKKFYNKQRRVDDPLYRFALNIRTAISKSIRNRGFTKKARAFEILGCSYEFFLSHIAKQFTDGMSVDKLGSEIHIDHIIPISSAITEECVLRLSHYSNFQPLWAADNLAKSDTMPPQEVIDVVNMIYECCKLN